jgi:nicotinate-nucleotide pyrophosphorylase (carboxylating)
MTRVDPLDPGRVAALVQAALEEDGAHADATARYLGLGDHRASAEIRVAGRVTVSGIDVARAVFRGVDAACTFDALARDAEAAEAGSAVARVEGRAASILAAERTALNFLQRMSGVATLATRFVEAVRGTGVAILDTRKTIPLWRELDKYAVRCGGARNHRASLDAMVMVKDNHVRALGGAGALLDRIARATDRGFIEVEVDSIDLLEKVIPARVDRVMLDNFTPARVAEAMEVVRAFRAAHAGRRLEVEVSGGITLENVRDYAQPGVDFISVGALTHSAPAAPMSLDVL